MATDNGLDEVMQNVATQIFDVAVNPLAGMLCSFLALQVSKGYISKDEAKGVIVSGLDLINQTEHSEYVLANGHDMLLRMVKAIDGIPNVAKSVAVE